MAAVLFVLLAVNLGNSLPEAFSSLTFSEVPLTLKGRAVQFNDSLPLTQQRFPQFEVEMFRPPP